MKITNRPMRATAVAYLAKASVSKQKLIKITGHASTSSIKRYLQPEQEHHSEILACLDKRNNYMDLLKVVLIFSTM